ncbi:MAG TPA: alpha/beta hydrolase [Ramlibacter sp.]|jgi:pimeloyl-ACP methyl ester carboxylesterase|uniref:alpha/beta hydrolase n=1 Tax=Ramlibacter sp. TaxID=1917967 RepID=UPI002D541288|nr:alpha/beta hydrolase [Ramlibacter sp.]HZY16829.1 alpha/beta hydrolase [Ramlibacter sp.]
MATFVLVHGAWHGGWCWRRVVERLERAGHRAHAVTLTGVGERAHLLSPAITLETHVEDVAAVIEAEELTDVVLAVHSYAGMIGTAIADRMGPRLRHLVFVDAVVPRPGESWSSTHARATREARRAGAQASADYSLAVPDPNNYGLAGADYAWVRRRLTPHPGHTYDATLDFDPERVAAVPRTFVNCTQPALPTIDAIRPRMADPNFWNGAWRGGGGAKVVELRTGHDPMVSLPQELADVLLACA